MAKSTNNTTKKSTKTDPHSKAREKAKEIQEKRKADKRVVDEIWAIITIALGIFFAVAIFSGGAGALGVILKDVMQGLFGHMAKVFPFDFLRMKLLPMAKVLVATQSSKKTECGFFRIRSFVLKKVNPLALHPCRR